MPRVSSKNNRRSHKKVRQNVKRRIAKGITPKENYKRMGLVAEPNNEASIVRHRGDRLNRVTVADFLAVVDDEPAQPLSGSIALQNPDRTPGAMKEEEVEYLQALVKKHGRDFVKMQRDLKVNFMQHSAQHLETRMKRMELFLSSRHEE
jgi:Ribosome biogenesis protein Nop16